MVGWKTIGTIVGSQFVGAGIQEAETYIDRPIVGTVMLSTLINIVGGLAGCFLAATGRVRGLEIPVAVISTKLLADEVMKQVKGTMTPARVYRAPTRVAPRVAPRARAAGLVTVD